MHLAHVGTDDDGVVAQQKELLAKLTDIGQERPYGVRTGHDGSRERTARIAAAAIQLGYGTTESGPVVYATPTVNQRLILR